MYEDTGWKWQWWKIKRFHLEGDVTDGEASDDDEENWIEDKDETDGETRDGGDKE